MNAAALVKQGQLREGLTALQQEIRQKPADVNLRVFLFQLDCVFGELEKALAQLQVIASLNSETMLLAQVFRPLITCETLRREVFRGRRTPLIFGEPLPWIGDLLKANEWIARGEFAAAAEHRMRAFDAADTTPGTLNGEAFDWIADADSRLGPVLEAYIEGKYYWVPFCRIQRLELIPPSDLRDLVWTPVQFVWTNGGACGGHIPVRYPATEATADGGLMLARRTQWREEADDTFLGLGQRVFATSAEEYPLFDCRTLEFGDGLKLG